MLLAALQASEENQKAPKSLFYLFLFYSTGFGKSEWTAAASLTVATHG